MAPNDEPCLDDLIAEFLERLDSGERIDAERFIADRPQHRQEFMSFVAQADAMQQWLNGGSVTGSTISRPFRRSSALSQPLVTVAGYRLGRRLGRGGMASVHEAFPADGEPAVAMKILNLEIANNAAYQTRFRREARVIGSIDHPAVVPLYDAGRDGDVFYLTMRLIDGVTLSDVITAYAPPQDAGTDEASLAETEATALLSGNSVRYCFEQSRCSSESYFASAARLIANAADALEAAHAAGVIHRDVKPSNLLLDGNGQLWLTDFGLSSLEDSQTVLTQTGDLLGTTRYMSPEQALGSDRPLDHRTDIYSLGATLYELATFRPAFSGNRSQVLTSLANQRLRLPTQVNSNVPRPLEAIILKAMAHGPQDRYVTADEMAQDLRRFAAGQTVRARHPTILDWIARWAQAHPVKALTAIAGCLAIALSFAAGQYLNSRRLEDVNRELSAANQTLEVTGGKLKAANSVLDAQDAELRRQLYAADLAAAYDAFERLQIQHARRLLKRQIPEGGKADLRGLEWRILDALTTSPPDTVFLGHTGEARAVAIIPGTRDFLTAGHDGFVRKWSLATGEQLAAFEIGGELDAVAVAPDGETFVVGKNVVEGLNPVTIRRCDDGSVLQELTGHDYSVEALEFSPDGRFVASAGRYTDVIIHDLASGEPVHRLTTGSRNETVSFFEAGGFVAAVIRQDAGTVPAQCVQIWDGPQPTPLIQLGDDLNVNVIDAFSDGRRILLASTDQLAIHDTQSGARLGLTESLPGRIRNVAVSPDDTIIVAITDSGLLAWWSLPREMPEGMLGVPQFPNPQISSLEYGRLTDIRFTDQTSVIVTAEDGSIHHLDLSVPRARCSVADVLGPHMAQSASTKDLYVVTRRGEVVRVDPLTTAHSVVARLPSQGSSRAIVLESRLEVILSSAQELVVLDIGQGYVKARRMFDVDGSSECRAIVLHPDGGHLYLIHSNCLRVYETENWTKLEQLEIPINHGDLSPDGRLLLLASENELQLYDANSLEPRMRHSRLGSHISLVEYSQTGKYAAIGRDDGSVEILAADTLSSIGTFEGHQTLVTALAFYDGDRKLASADNEGKAIAFWDLETQRLMGKLPLDVRVVDGLILCEEDSWVAVTSRDAPLSLWKVPIAAKP